MVVTDIMEKLYSILKCCLFHRKQLTSLLSMAIRVIKILIDLCLIRYSQEGMDVILYLVGPCSQSKI